MQHTREHITCPCSFVRIWQRHIIYPECLQRAVRLVNFMSMAATMSASGSAVSGAQITMFSITLAQTVCISCLSQFIAATQLSVTGTFCPKLPSTDWTTKICVKLNFNCLFTPDLMTARFFLSRFSVSVFVSGVEREKTSSKIMLSHNYVSCSRRLSSSHAPKLFSSLTRCENGSCASFITGATFFHFVTLSFVLP